MNAKFRSVEVDETTAELLEARAAARPLAMAELLADLAASEAGLPVKLADQRAPDVLAEDERRLMAFREERRGLDWAEVRTWWRRGAALQRGPRPRRGIASTPASRQNQTMPLHTLRLETAGPGLYEFTARAEQFVREVNAPEGLLTAFVRHTSCSLTVQENADPDVLRDLHEFFRRLVPQGDDPSMDWLRHTAEGPDDMPAHIRSALTQTSLGIPVENGRMLLGTWQGLFLFEHRRRPHRREVVLHLA